MAKGLEDTAFYRYNRFIALNEVGGEPQRIGSGVEEFHARECRARAALAARVSATATHDTKRGEDARARLAVLAELPDEWAEQVANGGACCAAPSRRSAARRERRVLLLSVAARRVAAGALRRTRSSTSARSRRSRERLRGALRKAVREAKRHSTGPRPTSATKPRCSASSMRRSSPAATSSSRGSCRSRAASHGSACTISLAQLALKMTAPGVPDIYQGCELWDFSLVDPDNRRRVDFAHRAALLDGRRGGSRRRPRAGVRAVAAAVAGRPRQARGHARAARAARARGRAVRGGRL